ncbi:MAG: hypothetical protein HY888_08150 [Deltaproteobacteria bacterium]|nr:hypothetical protein [Deltaproteobacteria bacterium]
MHKWIILFFMIILIALAAGCGGSANTVPSNYIGVFKSIRTSNDAVVFVTITADDGTSYEGLLDKLPVKGKWGEPVSDALGLVTYQLDKGSDTNFLDFVLQISGSGVSGTALRQ